MIFIMQRQLIKSMIKLLRQRLRPNNVNKDHLSGCVHDEQCPLIHYTGCSCILIILCVQTQVYVITPTLGIYHICNVRA